MGNGYCSSAPASLTPPRDTKGCAGCACKTASAGIASAALRTCLSLAVTSPASIAAWARARLSNRPRSTSNRSARLRAGGPLVLRLAKFNPVYAGGKRGAARPPCAHRSRTRSGLACPLVYVGASQVNLHALSSWPGVAVRRTASLPLAYARPSTSFLPQACQDVDAGDKPGHDE